MGKGREKIRGGAEIVKARESRDAGNNPGGRGKPRPYKGGRKPEMR